MDFDVLSTLLYVSIVVCAVLCVALIDFRIKFLRLKQKNYFLNRDRERYAETIYASKDGYFAFVYPDERIKDPRQTVRERCSRRLAVMLDLKNGRQSDFEDVLETLYKDDARKLKKYLSLMQEEGIAFEDTFFIKSVKRQCRVFGSRIHGADGNLYCDMLWFRDLSAELLKLEELGKELKEKNERIKTFEDLFDNLGFPVYLRDEKLQIVAFNKKYAELSKKGNQEMQSTREKAEWEKAADELSKAAIQTNKAQKKNVQIVLRGDVRRFEITEAPFHSADRLDDIGTVGTMIDMTELDTVKRTFKVHQNAHLEVLSYLGTAFAIFNLKSELIFYNKSFAQMWHLSAEELDKKLSYASFLNLIYSKRLIPEVRDFKGYKLQEEKLFSTLIAPKENLVHLPDGRTIRRFVAQHPNGLIFAYEDVSDRLEAQRTIHELMTVQQNILDGLDEAVLIFGADQRLKYYNPSYVRLFSADRLKLQNLPVAAEVFDMQKSHLENSENWEALKSQMLRHIFELCLSFKLEYGKGCLLEVKPFILADESVMVCYIKR
ncbi:MAG: PAS domain-containing protein [Alphaproteobacteria bacterium]|nr:PAS domain-containing protein [Alphaproteobacteria bacterium]